MFAMILYISSTDDETEAKGFKLILTYMLKGYGKRDV